MSVARSKQAIYMNTTPDSTATYNLVGKGVSEATIAYNPQTQTEQDIISDTASTDLTGYQPSVPLKIKIDSADAVFVFLDSLRTERAILSDAVTDIILVDTFKTAVTGAYPAEKQSVTVQVDDWGGAAADPLGLGVTLSYRGNATKGTFNPTTKAFVAS